MLGSFRRIVVITYHIVMMECASRTSKRLGSDIGHLKASWDFLGNGESVDHIVMCNVGICVMVTDAWSSINRVDDSGDRLVIFHNVNWSNNRATKDGLERSEDFDGTSGFKVDFELGNGRIFVTLRDDVSQRDLIKPWIFCHQTVSYVV